LRAPLLRRLRSLSLRGQQEMGVSDLNPDGTIVRIGKEGVFRVQQSRGLSPFHRRRTVPFAGDGGERLHALLNLVGLQCPERLYRGRRVTGPVPGESRRIEVLLPGVAGQREGRDEEGCEAAHVISLARPVPRLAARGRRARLPV